jgi:hypothetical protein
MKLAQVIIIAALIVAESVGSGFARPLMRPSVGAMVQPAALDCHAIGNKKAEELGGQLVKAGPIVKNGQEACLVVVLIPASDGNRPRRAEFVISN